MVFVKEDDIEKAIKAFRLEHERSGTAEEVKQRQCFIKPSERKRNQRRKAAIDLQRKKERLCR